MRIFTKVVAFGLCLIGSHAMAAQTLTGAQTKEVVSGHTFAWKSMKYKASGVSVYAPNGGFTITTNGKVEKGRWYSSNWTGPTASTRTRAVRRLRLMAQPH